MYIVTILFHSNYFFTLHSIYIVIYIYIYIFNCSHLMIVVTQATKQDFESCGIAALP